MKLKAFTDYICSTGNTGLGHSSHYTGAYTPPQPDDERCICGEDFMENSPDGFNYQLKFETVNSHYAADMVYNHGKEIWQQFSDDEWEHLPWHEVVKEEKTKAYITTQYKTLRGWAKSHEQPIRNVRLLKSRQGEWVRESVEQE